MPHEQDRARQRAGGGDYPRPPGQAVEVIEEPGVVLLAELVLVAGQLGLAAQLVQGGLEVEEEVRVGDEEGEGAQPPARAAEPGGMQRRAVASARPRQQQREHGGSSTSPAVYLKPTASPAAAPAAAHQLVSRPLGDPDREQQRQRHRRERPTSVTAMRENATGRNAKQSTAAATSPVRRSHSCLADEVDGRDPDEAEHRRERARDLEDPSALCGPPMNFSPPPNGSDTAR